MTILGDSNQSVNPFSSSSLSMIHSTFLDYDSTAFAGGIVVTSAHIAKGLEFDVVIVPHADDMNYASEMDRGMLYVACTRAMHELHLTHTGPVSRFLEFAKAANRRLGVDDYRADYRADSRAEVRDDAETAEIRDRATDARVG